MKNKLMTEYENTHAIYQIINLIDGKVYVGSALNLNKRFIYHKCNLNKKKHTNTYLQNAVNKYGLENFDFKILEIVNDKSQLRIREQFYIDEFKCVIPLGYNLLPKAGSPLGIKLSKETKFKISESIKGRKHTEESKKKMSEWQIGRKMSDDAISNMKKAKLGNNYRRLKSKWPCPDGYYCNCENCRLKKKKIKRELDLKNNRVKDRFKNEKVVLL